MGSVTAWGFVAGSTPVPSTTPPAAACASCWICSGVFVNCFNCNSTSLLATQQSSSPRISTISEERRVGKECVSPVSLRWSRYPLTQHHVKHQHAHDK